MTVIESGEVCDGCGKLLICRSCGKFRSPNGAHPNSMKLFISEPFARGDGPILVHDEANNDIAEFFHDERHTVPQSYETALALAQKLVTCDVAQTDLLSRSELERYFRTEEYADEIADIISNFPPAESTTLAQPVGMRDALIKAEGAFECIRLTLVGHLDEPERTAFWKAVEARNAVRATLAAQPPAAPVEIGVLSRLVDWTYLHATEGETWPSSKTKADLITRARQDAPRQEHADGMKAVAPPRSSAGSALDAHAYATDWKRQIVNAGVDENLAQQAVTLAALNGLFDHLRAVPQVAQVTEKPRPSDCPWPVDCMWRHVPTVPEIGLHLCNRFGCPHTTKGEAK